MLKTVKGKILSGVIVVSVVSGAGAALADTDFGAKLKGWYDGQFETVSSKLWKDNEKYGLGKAGELITHSNKESQENIKDINTQRDYSIKYSSDEMNKDKKRYIDQVKNKEQELVQGMDSQFDLLYKKAEAEIAKYSDQGFAAAQGILKTNMDPAGEKALAQVETDLTKAKGAALDALRQAIDESKSNLNQKLSNQSNVTDAKIKKAINAEVVALKAKITTEAQGLAKKHNEIIEAKANEILKTAKDELKDVQI